MSGKAETNAKICGVLEPKGKKGISRKREWWTCVNCCLRDLGRWGLRLIHWYLARYKSWILFTGEISVEWWGWNFIQMY